MDCAFSANGLPINNGASIACEKGIKGRALGDNRYKKIIHHLFIIAVIPILPILHLEPLSAFFYFVLLFLVVGNSLKPALFQSLNQTNPMFNSLSGVLIDIILSTTITSAVLITLGLIRLIGATYLVITIITILADTYLTLQKSSEEAITELEINVGVSLREDAFYLFILISVGISLVLWRISYLICPEVYGTDIFTHIAVAEIIINDGGTSSVIGAYPYVWHELVASFAITCGLQPYVIIGYGPLISCPSLLIAAYLFLRALTGQIRLSLLGALLIGFVNESGALLGPQYAYPSLYAFTVALVILAALKSYKLNIRVTYLCILSYSVIFITYPYIILGTLTSFLFIGIYFQTHSILAKRFVDWLFWMGIILCIGLFVVYYGILPLFGLGRISIDVEIAQLAISYTIDRQVRILFIAYSIPQGVLFAIGFLKLVSNRRKIAAPLLGDYRIDHFVLMTLSLYSFLYFSPIDVALRVEVYIRPLIFVCMVIGGNSILETMKRLRLIKSATHLHMEPEGRTLISVSLLLMLSIVPTTIMMDRTYLGEDYKPNPDEFQAFEWLKSNTPVGGYILTDPATGLIMRGYTMRNCSTSFIEEDRTPSPRRYVELYNSVFDFFNASSWNENEAYHAIEMDRKGVSYIVISPRTAAWLSIERTGKSGIYAPYAQWIQEDDPALSKFNGPEYRIVGEFGELKILQKQDITILFNEQFDNATSWKTNIGNEIYIEDGVCHWYNPANDSEWFYLYSDSPSFDSSNGLNIRTRIRCNTSGLAGWIVTFSEDEAQGDRSYSDWIYLSDKWQTLWLQLEDFNDHNENGFESIGFAFTSPENNWNIEIDYFIIYENA